jgi:glucokinase-like ROK family protein
MSIFKLTPVYKDYIWGGTALIEKYGKKTSAFPCAESWELSLHPDGTTRVGESSITELLTDEIIGKNAGAFDKFPMLVKLIDAKGNLSVQVHPSDDYALENEQSYGKTEMWYIVEADESAGIYLGFSREVTKDEVRAAIESNTLCNLLKFYPVKAGEAYFIPAGTVHAIGAGCLICEIQQNSNLTYRVYDYGRKDKNGNSRELHIEKALAVTDLDKFENKSLSGDILGASKYFSVRRLNVNGNIRGETGEKSFCAFTCIKGEGFIDGQKIKPGESYFLPANYGKYIIEGETELIMTDVRKYYVGIDLGGTYIKGGIVDDQGCVVTQDKIPTEREKGSCGVVKNIVSLCNMLLEKANMTVSDVVGVGIGVPGMIDSKAGVVVYSNNLDWADFAISKEIESILGLPVRIANDANVAALGETRFGCGKDYQNSVMVTLGTGVGSGIVIDGKLFEGNRSAGAELGHSVIVAGGEPCTCGRRGCLEAYASATALIRDTKRAMEANPDSSMWEVGSLDAVTGRCAFDRKDTDPAAKAVVDSYIEKLGVGITNIANEFRPEIIILGGGVCSQGENLTKPLQDYLDR